MEGARGEGEGELEYGRVRGKGREEVGREGIGEAKKKERRRGGEERREGSGERVSRFEVCM